MGIKSSGIARPRDSIKTKLLQDVRNKIENNQAFYGNKKKFIKKKSAVYDIRCSKKE